MTNDSKQAQAENAEVITEEMVIDQEGTDESGLMDELTQANFRIEELEQQLATAESTVVEQKDSVVRAAAEVENIRRRSAVEVEKARKFALEKFVNELLPVIDNMERALAAGDADNEATKAIHEGVELTLKTLTSAVAKFGVVQIDPTGEAFNPEQHQAIGMQPSTEFAANTVMMVMQKGFMLNERLLRPAMVMVSQG
ncbi:nucleotide exchange factor GrpE [Shewanella sp. NIFS-20-20]|uniref:nucleotide exchange factor GrpE n=1 Tax=Shewanella sp. NIFS-20-20 TaxID=2853806 RepID=UPI001C48A5B1|nr:nucleotide exchange factor GrpE [Shewanella sp. NIFS-20-20]MBV7315342.1 nucleotide exchange factor GrpE [Shewanella sp. NIFS-20-20]